ncbi:keto-deoxy-phosphogluconate aldolase, partial [Marinobacter confluentis]
NVTAVGGTWLTPGGLVAAGDWDGISEIVRGRLADL